jgi:hypothetical protein
MKLSLQVWIRGDIDGSPAVHRFEQASDYAGLLTIDTCSTKDFVPLEIEIDETLESDEPGYEPHDTWERGFAFDSYG